MNNVYLLIGGNMGNRQQYLREAKLLLAKHCGQPVKHSSVYETAAWGNTNQPSFLNEVLLLQTTLPPDDLMKKILEIEESMGRERKNKWDPRTIDIDILFYNDRLYKSSNVIIPHPEIQNRRFVLEPMNELNGNFIHPGLNRSIHQLLTECPDQLQVKRIN